MDLKKISCHPVVFIVAILGSLASLISVPLAFYFYFQARLYPNLVYYVHPVKAALVRAGSVSSLETIYNGKKIEGDITVAQIGIWNCGNGTIKNSNVLKPIVIRTGKSERILEAIIRKKTRDIIDANIEDGELNVWKIHVAMNILENNDGVIIQVTYIGDDKVDFQVEGVIEGQKTISPFSCTLENSFRIKNYSIYITSGVGFLILVLFFRWLLRRNYHTRLQEINSANLETLRGLYIKRLNRNAKVDLEDYLIPTLILLVPVVAYLSYVLREKVPLEF